MEDVFKSCIKIFFVKLISSLFICQMSFQFRYSSQKITQLFRWGKIKNEVFFVLNHFSSSHILSEWNLIELVNLLLEHFGYWHNVAVWFSYCEILVKHSTFPQVSPTLSSQVSSSCRTPNLLVCFHTTKSCLQKL